MTRQTGQTRFTRQKRFKRQTRETDRETYRDKIERVRERLS